MAVTRFPFAGVVSERPYPPTGLTTARWAAEVPARWVQFADLWLTQRGVDILAMFGLSERVSDLYPHAVTWQGLMWLEDGHNRLLRRALRGEYEAEVRVYDID